MQSRQHTRAKRKRAIWALIIAVGLLVLIGMLFSYINDPKFIYERFASNIFSEQLKQKIVKKADCRIYGREFYIEAWIDASAGEEERAAVFESIKNLYEPDALSSLEDKLNREFAVERIHFYLIDYAVKGHKRILYEYICQNHAAEDERNTAATDRCWIWYDVQNYGKPLPEYERRIDTGAARTLKESLSGVNCVADVNLVCVGADVWIEVWVDDRVDAEEEATTMFDAVRTFATVENMQEIIRDTGQSGEIEKIRYLILDNTVKDASDMLYPTKVLNEYAAVYFPLPFVFGLGVSKYEIEEYRIWYELKNGFRVPDEYSEAFRR
jgi:hypothetical protein